jgi:CRP-like cAMP-binding protein
MPVKLMTRNVLRNRIQQISAAERDVLESAVSSVSVIPAGRILVRQGDVANVSTLLLEGMMTRHVDGIEGQRHLVGIHVPGDFVDLHAYALKKLDHDVGALTDVRVAIFNHSTLERIQANHLHLTRLLWFLTLLDAALHRQWIRRLSSLTAMERVANFICEMNSRLLAIDASDGQSFELPMTQVALGEVCSLTNVHVNRVLRQLREMELCTVRSSLVEIHDLKGLAEIGQFSPDYLYLNHQTAARAVGKKVELQ